MFCRATVFARLVPATLLLIPLLQGCAAPEKIGDPGCESEPCQELRVYVANQGRAIDPIVIDVYLDDIHVITGPFGFGEGRDWYRFDFLLDQGAHTLSLSSPDTSRTLGREISLGRDRWAVIGFYDSSFGADGEPLGTGFGLDVLDEEPTFY